MLEWLSSITLPEIKALEKESYNHYIKRDLDVMCNAFLKVLDGELKNFKDDTPLKNLNMTKMLNNYIMRQYNKRKVNTPDDEE